MYKLQSGVELPPTIRPSAKGRRKKYPFEDMQVNDFFFVPDRTRNTLGTHVYTVGKELGRQFSTRLTYMRKNARGDWELCEAGDPGANQGVMVMRTE